MSSKKFHFRRHGHWGAVIEKIPTTSIFQGLLGFSEWNFFYFSYKLKVFLKYFKVNVSLLFLLSSYTSTMPPGTVNLVKLALINTKFTTAKLLPRRFLRTVGLAGFIFVDQQFCRLMSPTKVVLANLLSHQLCIFSYFLYLIYLDGIIIFPALLLLNLLGLLASNHIRRSLPRKHHPRFTSALSVVFNLAISSTAIFNDSIGAFSARIWKLN